MMLELNIHKLKFRYTDFLYIYILFNTKLLHSVFLIIAAACFSLKDGQELRPKHVEVIINNNAVQQVVIRYYICNIVAWKMYNFKHRFFTDFYVILVYCINTLLLWAGIA